MLGMVINVTHTNSAIKITHSHTGLAGLGNLTDRGVRVGSVVLGDEPDQAAGPQPAEHAGVRAPPVAADGL